jgi:hypothetical protein
VRPVAVQEAMMLSRAELGDAIIGSDTTDRSGGPQDRRCGDEPRTDAFG